MPIEKFISTNRRGFIQIRMVNNRRWSAYFINIFVHARLSTLKPIHAALTSQDLSFDTKFAPTQSYVMLPLNDAMLLRSIAVFKILMAQSSLI